MMLEKYQQSLQRLMQKVNLRNIVLYKNVCMKATLIDLWRWKKKQKKIGRAFRIIDENISTKVPLGPYDIIIAYSRHVETVILITRCGNSDKRTKRCRDFEAKSGRKSS